MKRIGLTQRVEVITSYGERRDCLDQNWNNLLVDLGYMPVPLPNLSQPKVIENYLQALSLDGVILTGGNDLCHTQSVKAAKERDFFETALINYCIQKKIPILGVCRGMQMLNVHLNGSLTQVLNHVCANHTVTLADGLEIQVNSYHDWGIIPEGLAKDLIPLGHSEDGFVEYVKHKKLAMTAIMWHPERANKNQEIGLTIIKETFL